MKVLIFSSSPTGGLSIAEVIKIFVSLTEMYEILCVQQWSSVLDSALGVLPWSCLEIFAQSSVAHRSPAA